MAVELARRADDGEPPVVMGDVDEMRGGVNLTLRVERARTGTHQGVRGRCECELGAVCAPVALALGQCAQGGGRHV